MRKLLGFVVLSALSCFAQTILPEGTKLRVRLEQPISSSTAEEGQHVELNVTDAVKIGDNVIIAEGAHATGTITRANEKRRMGRSGKLDFSIDRVKAIDNQWIPLRYTVTKKTGQSHALSTGILTAGTAAVFWPAAPVFLLRKGQDITINRDVTFEVYTDRNYTINTAASTSNRAPAPSAPPAATLTASVSIISSVPAADIEVDGVFVGNTPTTIQLENGSHVITVKKGSRSWERKLQVGNGNKITLNATLF